MNASVDERSPRTRAALGLVVLLFAASGSYAGTAHAAPSDDAAVEVRPPSLEGFVEAPFPPSAEVDEAVVVLKLSIDASGEVLEVTVVESAGPAFDEAAQAAAASFTFAPALRGNTPMPSRILYRYRFERPSPPPPVEGSLAGEVTLAGEAEPVVGAAVTVVGADGRAQRTRTDLSGRYTFDALPEGVYTLRVEAEGLGSAELSAVVEPGEATQTAVALVPPEEAVPIEVTVEGPSAAERLRRSSAAVQVVETEDAKQRTADLGEVLARTKGVGVRRGGGLGSGVRFSLNGLTDDQVRFFVDGVPLEFSGYPFGIANVPVNLVDRVEVYRGVVPVRFGADALGGAVNLVTDDDVEGTHGGASYQAGSFGTHRATATARHLHEPSGFFVRAAGFYDTTQNDYPIQVEVPDAQGRLSPATVRRYHDGYRAAGINLETGLVDRDWADRLLVRGFVTEHRKELQHNVVMTIPYGAVEYGALAAGANVRYENVFRDRFSVEVLGGYAYSAIDFEDLGSCVYSWFGQCLRDRPQPGELGAASDQTLWEHSAYGRAVFGWQIRPRHAVRVSMSPTYTTRTGEERELPEAATADPLDADQDLFSFVSGAEYEVDLFSDRLENVAFLKSYVQRAEAELFLPGGAFERRDRTITRGGLGDMVRVRILDWLYAKTSYEWATRLPRVEEVFGDGVLVVENLDLKPEVSHNVNLGLTMDLRTRHAGAWRADANGFLRDADDLIVLLGNDRVFTYQNVFGARSTGVEGSLGWTSVGDYVAIDGNATYLDLRNTAARGTFGDFEGDRIPNRPWLFANGSAQVGVSDVAVGDDRISLTWNTRYVHGFFRGWESAGLTEFKQTVPAQLLHAVALSYGVRGDPLAMGFTAEMQNVTDAPAFDFFGVQRPGRAVYFKITLEY